MKCWAIVQPHDITLQTKPWLVGGIQKNILTFILKALTFPNIRVYLMKLSSKPLETDYSRQKGKLSIVL